MSGINIKIEPGQQIEVEGKRYEAVAFREPSEGEFWLTVNGNAVNDGYYGNPRLILRPLPVRKVPTDQDAAVWPRRKCWVRDFGDKPWQEAELFSVADHEYPFSTTSDELVRTCWRFCEIEVQE
jgi:hypothetical protein